MKTVNEVITWFHQADEDELMAIAINSGALVCTIPDNGVVRTLAQNRFGWDLKIVSFKKRPGQIDLARVCLDPRNATTTSAWKAGQFALYQKQGMRPDVCAWYHAQPQGKYRVELAGKFQSIIDASGGCAKVAGMSCDEIRTMFNWPNLANTRVEVLKYLSTRAMEDYHYCFPWEKAG